MVLLIVDFKRVWFFIGVLTPLTMIKESDFSTLKLTGSLPTDWKGVITTLWLSSQSSDLFCFNTVHLEFKSPHGVLHKNRHVRQSVKSPSYDS